MHEMTLAVSMLRLIEDQLGRKPRLLSANVTVGLFAGVEVESLRFCFTELAKAEGFGEPELVVKKAPLHARCRDCDAEYEMTDVLEVCPKCSSIDRHLDGGYEFTLDCVEIMEDDGEPGEAEEG